MDPNELPQFPVEQAERLPVPEKARPPVGESLSILFEFSIGLALANGIVLIMTMPFFPAIGWPHVAFEAPLFFGLFGVLIAVSRLSSIDQAAGAAFDDGHLGGTYFWARLGVLAIIGGLVAGIGMGIGFAIALGHFFAYLQAIGKPIDSRLANLLAAVLIGALVGMIGGGGLVLAGGTPDWKAGRLLTALGRIVPALIRVFDSRRPDAIQLRGRPWVEGVVWFALVVGPLLWFLW